MELAKKYRLKIFLWDQFIRPVYLLLNIHQLQALLLALLIINFVTWKNIYIFWFLAFSLGVIFSYQIYKDYKSGEFIYNYRRYKSDKGKYGDYRKLTKILKKEENKNLEQEIEIEDVDGDVNAENVRIENKDINKAINKITNRLTEQNPDWQMKEINEMETLNDNK